MEGVTLRQLTGQEASALAFCGRHPKSREAKSVAKGLTGHAAVIAKRLTTGRGGDDSHIAAAEAILKWARAE